MKNKCVVVDGSRKQSVGQQLAIEAGKEVKPAKEHVVPLTASEIAEVILLACFVMGFGALLIS